MKRYEYIKYLLRCKRITQRELAKELDCSRENVTGVLSGSFKSRRVMEHIAKCLGRDFDKLWGKAA